MDTILSKIRNQLTPFINLASMVNDDAPLLLIKNQAETCSQNAITLVELIHNLEKVTIFLVMARSGDMPDDERNWVAKAFYSEADAQDYIDRKRAQHKRLLQHIWKIDRLINETQNYDLWRDSYERINCHYSWYIRKTVLQ